MNRRDLSKIFSKNESAISSATAEKYPCCRAKPISVNVHFVQEQVKSVVLEICYIPYLENDADILTKAVGMYFLKSFNSRLEIGGFLMFSMSSDCDQQIGSEYSNETCVPVVLLRNCEHLTFRSPLEGLLANSSRNFNRLFFLPI